MFVTDVFYFFVCSLFFNKKWSILNKYTPVFDVRLSNANIQLELGIDGVDFFSRIVFYDKV